MASAVKVLAFVFLVCVLIPQNADAGMSDCYETWSRCSRWSSGFTGILWKSCNDRCKELKRRGGNCVLTRSKCPLSSKAYQCQCY